MYAARTQFKAPDGISLLYESPQARKLDEENAIVARLDGLDGRKGGWLGGWAERG